MSFGHGFELFGTRVLNKNNFKKLSHASISLYKFNLERARTIYPATSGSKNPWCKNKKWSVNAVLHDRLISRKSIFLLRWSFNKNFIDVSVIYNFFKTKNIFSHEKGVTHRNVDSIKILLTPCNIWSTTIPIFWNKK